MKNSIATRLAAMFALASIVGFALIGAALHHVLDRELLRHQDEQITNRIDQVEGEGKNPRSSATGTGNFVDETVAPNPQTAYAECKVLVERDVGAMAGSDFCPVFLRNATAYGPSPRMRFDIVLNDLSAMAHTTKRIAMASCVGRRPGPCARNGTMFGCALPMRRGTEPPIR